MPTDRPASVIDRCRFFVLTAIVGATAIAARATNAATSSVEAIRQTLRIPAPRTKVTVPTIDPSTWRLTIDGMVDRNIELTFDDIIAMGLDEFTITLNCVSDEVGGHLVGNAK